MRAILKSVATIDDQELEEILTRAGFMPALDKTDPLVVGKRDEIMRTVSREDLPIVEATFKLVILDSETSTWGIVSQPAKHQFEFRLKNDRRERLKPSCKKLVDALGKGQGGAFEFKSPIKVLAPGAQDEAFTGIILPPQRFWYAVKARKVEAIVGAFFGGVALFVSMLTTPLAADVMLGSCVTGIPCWGEWGVDNLGRLATSGIVTFTVTWAGIYLHYLDLKRKTVIEWSA